MKLVTYINKEEAMECHLEEVYKDGTRMLCKTSPNGHPGDIYPSRGWATASATLWVSSWEHRLWEGKVKDEVTPVSIDVVIEGDGKIYKSLPIIRKP